MARLLASIVEAAPHWILIAGLGIAAAATLVHAIRTEQLLAMPISG